jgi:asparagine synthase (glutamine-hydrolysing)
MCGIAGCVDIARDRTNQELTSAVERMIRPLKHRGPDDAGVWTESSSGVGLGHRRLSIIDLSPDGHQPMQSQCGRFVVVFNGEIYNFRELRTELCLAGQYFRSHSDTEVLLAAISKWGLKRALQRFVGMFAFAVWDRQEKCLSLARDRFGEKPLYYGRSGGTFLFGSELKALRGFPGASFWIDRDALALYFHGGYIPGPFSIYKGVRKLVPGSFLTVHNEQLARDFVPEPAKYWDLAAAAAAAGTFAGSEAEAIVQVEALIRSSVAGQMVADVPLGAFLSGGIDSSAVVAAMQALSSKPVKTFTIGFHETAFNEAQHAAAVASHLRTDHTELYVTPAEAMAVIPKLPQIYDEPFSDSSQIPTYLVSQLARSRVTVSLSGDGGDELFAGYPRYALAERIWARLRLLPRPMRTQLASVLRGIPVKKWNAAANLFCRALGRPEWANLGGDRIHKAAELLDLRSDSALYWNLVSHWKHPESLVLGASAVNLDTAQRSAETDLGTFLERMCYADSTSYLPDDILVKVDRASMAVSLESRVPLLDHRLVEFAWTLPSSFKSGNRPSKHLLREVLFRQVPKELIERPKMGFGVPLDQWLSGPLRGWAAELLSDSRLKQEGFLDAAQVRVKWSEHLAGTRRWHYYLWDVLMFQAWLEAERSSSAREAQKSETLRTIAA